jgi:hypothetical protein
MKTVVPYFIGGALLISNLPALALCSADSFSIDSVSAQLNELSDEKRNLNALLRVSREPTVNGLLLTAEARLDTNYQSGTLFVAMLRLHGLLQSPVDRKSSNEFISVAAEILGGNADRAADTITPMAAAAGESHYAAEFQAARDKLRGWSRLFACSH